MFLDKKLLKPIRRAHLILHIREMNMWISRILSLDADWAQPLPIDIDFHCAVRNSFFYLSSDFFCAPPPCKAPLLTLHQKSLPLFFLIFEEKPNIYAKVGECTRNAAVKRVSSELDAGSKYLSVILVRECNTFLLHDYESLVIAR